jgi:hypothetical protein
MHKACVTLCLCGQNLCKQSKQTKMNNEDYHTSFTVDALPQKVFERINEVTQWWTKNLEGESKQFGDEFTVRFSDLHTTTQKLTEVIPGKKVVWPVTESNLSFVDKKDEWTDTNIVFEITEKDGKTEVLFTHVGLVPEVACYTSCVKGWDYYIKGSLFKLLTEGKGTSG